MAEPNPWILIRPPMMSNRQCRLLLRRCARALARIKRELPTVTSVADIRDDAVEHVKGLRADVAVPLLACVHVLCDLRLQGWQFRTDRHSISAKAPMPGALSVDEEKSRVRSAHLIERDVQLSQPTTRRFIRNLEHPRLFNGEWRSIFSLMRDGRELSQNLAQIAQHSEEEARLQDLRSLVDPYIQVIRKDDLCEFTGLKLFDVWRYFRHTWTTAYQSTPGRRMFFLVRDRAAPNHPVVGIGALGSAIVQLSVRDEWIGWTGSKFIEQLRAEPTAASARWIARSLDALIASIHSADLVREGVVSRAELSVPTDTGIRRLREFAHRERGVHQLFPNRAEHKRVQLTEETGDDMNWSRQAATPLFRSKRAGALADLLEARRVFATAGLSRGSARRLREALESREVTSAIQVVLRKMKAAHVGINMMDITVCGAVAPYTGLLGGKLVSLLMASPDAIAAYQGRYKVSQSVIASSMAGKPVRRRPRLVLLGTTSLYGAGASQYNRIRVPALAVGGAATDALTYELLGKTIGYGSYHFSRETMAAFDEVLRRLSGGRPVNSIFGEGVNPKLRKVRGGLDAIGLPSDLLLQHGSPRLVYAVSLASNFREVLLGQSLRPRYTVPQTAKATALLVEFWRRRWLNGRISRPDVLESVARHSLAHPVRHGARVVLPEVPSAAASEDEGD